MIVQPFAGNVHPRLLFSGEEITSCRNRAAHDPALRTQLEALEHRAAAMLDAGWLTQAYADEIYSQHGRYYEVGGQLVPMAETLGFLYCLTGRRAYAEKLRDGLLWYARFDVWTGPANKDRDTPWHSDLSTTRILYAYALGCDCIDAMLTPEERTTLHRAMLEKGIRPLLDDWVLPDTRIHALDSMGHNWWAVCISLAGVGLCSIYEEVPEAPVWMEQILEALHGFCTYAGEILFSKPSNFDAQGLFYESAGYFNYGVGELMRFAFVYRRLFPDGQERTAFAHMEQVPRTFLTLSYPTSDPAHPLLFPNFGDSSLDGGFRELPLYMLLCGYDTPELRYLYHIYKRNAPDLFDFLYPEKLGKKDASLAHLPRHTVFPDSGFAYLRTSFENDAVLLAVRCGYTWNHAHDDAGHFMLFADGAPVLPDAGTCSYSHPAYGSYFRTCQAHNVITINGHTQPDENIGRGSKFPGTLSHFVDGEMTALLADATGPTCTLCSRNYRTFLWLEPDLLVVFDELRTHAPASFASLLHYTGEAVSENPHRLSVHGKTPLCADVVFPQAVHTEWRDGLVTAEESKPYAAFCADETSRTMQFMTFYGLHEAAAAHPAAWTAPNQLGMTLVYHGTTYQIAFNLLADGRKMHENSNTCLLGFDTDAYLLVRRLEADGRETVLFLSGSYLRRGGQSLFSSFAKQSVCLPLPR